MLSRTRAEFQHWATSAAQQAGYSVHYEGVGAVAGAAGLPPDTPATAAAAAVAMEFATQIAVFQRLESP